MTEDTQKLELHRSKRDVALDGASFLFLSAMVYLVMHPEVYDRMTGTVNMYLNKLAYRLSIWQTKLSIWALPETDNS